MTVKIIILLMLGIVLYLDGSDGIIEEDKWRSIYKTRIGWAARCFLVRAAIVVGAVILVYAISKT